jgi:hypothetical protein
MFGGKGLRIKRQPGAAVSQTAVDRVDVSVVAVQPGDGMSLLPLPAGHATLTLRQ